MEIKLFVTGPLATNTYLVWQGLIGLVIDPGLGSAQALLDYAVNRGISIGHVVNTHGHWDHMAGDAELVRCTSADLYVHELDAPMVRNPASRLPTTFALEPATPTILLREGSEIAIGDLKLRIFETPGHTPGGICLLAEAERAVFTGDTLFAGTHGRVDLPGGNAVALFASLRRLAGLPEEYTIYPGHGPSSTIAQEQPWLMEI